MPVTEYVLVYRKRTDLLIDWHIRNHPDQDLVTASKIGDDYEHTNIWRIQPDKGTKRPAVVPMDLVRKVISHYSLKGDVVLDPFADVGTVGEAAARLDRGFVLFKSNVEKFTVIQQASPSWLDEGAAEILIWSSPIDFLN